MSGRIPARQVEPERVPLSAHGQIRLAWLAEVVPFWQAEVARCQAAVDEHSPFPDRAAENAGSLTRAQAELRPLQQEWEALKDQRLGEEQVAGITQSHTQARVPWPLEGSGIGHNAWHHDCPLATGILRGEANLNSMTYLPLRTGACPRCGLTLAEVVDGRR